MLILARHPTLKDALIVYSLQNLPSQVRMRFGHKKAYGRVERTLLGGQDQVVVTQVQ